MNQRNYKGGEKKWLEARIESLEDSKKLAERENRPMIVLIYDALIQKHKKWYERVCEEEEMKDRYDRV